MGLKLGWGGLLLRQEYNVSRTSSMLVEEVGDGRAEFEKHILSRRKVDGGEEVFLNNGLTYLVMGEGENRRMQLIDKNVTFVRE